MSNHIIDQAIKENKAIEFYYTKYSGENSKRKVSNISYSNEYGAFGYQNDHIKGYCHLRNENRTFKINRMSRITLASATSGSYSSPPPTYRRPSPKKKEGCYIATMVYGDYNHPQVLILRGYRDNQLAKTILGRLFIRTYYLISPKVVWLLQGQDKINKFIEFIINKLTKHITSWHG